jgi:PhnB protein
MTIQDGKPDGYTTLTPFLVCRPAAEAIAWYETVLGARLVDRMDGPDGVVMHAELDFGDGRLQLSDPMDAYGLAAPARADEQVSSSTCIYVGDVDKVFAAAVERGAPYGRSRPPSSPATASPRSSTRSATAGRS